MKINLSVISLLLMLVNGCSNIHFTGQPNSGMKDVPGYKAVHSNELGNN